MKKLTKEQLKAVETLAIDIDELDNKPRRLFSALRDFAIAFRENKKEDTQDRKIIDSIDEFEEFYYRQIRIPEMAKNILDEARNTRREIFSQNDKHSSDDSEYHNGFENGVKEAIKLFSKKAIISLIDEN